MSSNEQWNGYQTMAWIAWRNRKAVRLFSGEDAEQLWKAAKAGSLPKGLGKPHTPLITAEMELQRAVQLGRIRNIAGMRA